MALAPRSSLRSLVLVLSHGKPRLSSFFSSCSAAVPPTPAAPAVQPPSAPDPGRKNDEGVGYPLADPPNRDGDAVIDKPSPSTTEIPDESVPEDIRPRFPNLPIPEEPWHPVHDPPPPPPPPRRP